jgi:mannose-1-phosphate guanylyltransferase
MSQNLSTQLTAVLLAGGIGQRLQPLTAQTPKALLPVANLPMLGQILHGLASSGVEQAALGTGHLADQISATLGDGSEYGIALRHVPEQSPLGSGGAVRHVVESLESTSAELAPTFWIAGADILHDVDIAAALEAHQRTGALVTVLCVEVPAPTDFGICEFAADGQMTAFYEKPAPGVTASRWANTALWIFDRAAIAMLPAEPSSIEKEFFPWLLAQGLPIYAYRHSGYWLDCGTPERYRQAQRDALAGRFPARINGTRSQSLKQCASLLGHDCKIAESAQLHRCTLGNAVSIGTGASLEDCVLLEGAHVGAHSHLRHCIIGAHHFVEAGTTRDNVIF